MDEFKGWLQKGLGRAAIFLQKHDSAPYRDALLYACTHNLTFDPQCEDRRAPYLMKLIEIAGDGSFYRDGIVSALAADDEDTDLRQMFEIAGAMAARGDSEIKRSMYTAFERRGFAKAELHCAEELVRLDGLGGLLFAAKTFGEIEAGDRPWQFGGLVEILEQRDGKTSLPAELDGFAREWREHEQYLEQLKKRPPEPRPDYASLKPSITIAGAVNWARDATPEELAVAAEDLLAEADPKRQLAYLRMFMRREFPKPIDRLLELARSEHERVAYAALRALRSVHDPRVRALGLELMNVSLLIRNSEPGDYRILETALLETSIDLNVYHWRLMDVMDFVEAHPSEEADRILLLLYENTPCAHCRHGAVEKLIAMDRLPDWIREECQYDTYSETRALVSV